MKPPAKEQYNGLFVFIERHFDEAHLDFLGGFLESFSSSSISAGFSHITALKSCLQICDLLGPQTTHLQ